MSRQVQVIVIGAGSRGNTYADFEMAHPERMKVVGVAEPRPDYRARFAERHHIAADHCWTSWEEVAALPKMADAVLICTMDTMHEAPAIAFAQKGYNILLEKPMAITPDACKRITAAVKNAGVIFAVCHVLRYTAYTQTLKKMIENGAVGEIVSIQHLEPVGHWHQAHSFVRGNWRNSELSSCMLLQKCCHDLDWLRYIIGKPCRSVQSFGSLTHFRKECAPQGASDRCVTCPASVSDHCPFNAVYFYLKREFAAGRLDWPIRVLTLDVTEKGIMKALTEGPYGRCVYHCDNDVVDHQVVNMEFDKQITAQLTMTAFCNEGARQTRIFGTRGAIRTDSQTIYLTDFMNGEEKAFDTKVSNDGTINSGHGGGDFGLMDAFIRAVAEHNPKYILSSADETLESHLMVFAAEQSRLERRICDVQ